MQATTGTSRPLAPWLHAGEIRCEAICVRQAAEAVCRIDDAIQGLGTGFVIARGVIMTNHHVLASPRDCRGKAVKFFLDSRVVSIGLRPDLLFVTSPRWATGGHVDQDHLDFTIVGIEVSAELEAIFDNPIRLFDWKDEAPKQAALISYPYGGQKIITWGKIDKIRPFEVSYRLGTVEGSSGSPLLGIHKNALQLFSLHHSGSAAYDSGSRLKAILCKIPALFRDHPIPSWAPFLTRTDREVRELCRYYKNQGLLRERAAYLRDHLTETSAEIIYQAGLLFWESSPPYWTMFHQSHVFEYVSMERAIAGQIWEKAASLNHVDAALRAYQWGAVKIVATLADEPHGPNANRYYAQYARAKGLPCKDAIWEVRPHYHVFLLFIPAKLMQDGASLSAATIREKISSTFLAKNAG
jgi:V8-like Glu-specific endopeptidase